MHDFAVVGSGIGGSAIAALLDAKGYDVALIEKEPYLGGCSSCFEHKGHRYNTGATTFAGYEAGNGVKALFDAAGRTPQLIETDPALIVIQNGNRLARYRDLERFLDEIERVHPHPKNRAFWKLVHDINIRFYALQGYGYSARSLSEKLASLLSYTPVAVQFAPYLCISAARYIKYFFGTLSKEYQDFIDAQLLIVAQSRSEEINFLTAALALGYTFGANHYSVGGMGSLFDALTCNIKTIHRNTAITHIEPKKWGYLLHSRKRSIEAKNLILNTTVYDSAKLFSDEKFTRFYGRFERLDNHQSAFMLYLTLRSDAVFDHHYQIIMPEVIPYTISQALFVSFSDASDRVMAPEGHYSVTASIHTDSRWWDSDEPALYRAIKEKLASRLLQLICDTLDIRRSQIVDHFAATPRTFRHYLGRSQLGGNAMTMQNFLPRLPGNDTPIRGLYHVGDSVYAAQGWPGVVTGVQNLARLLDA